MTTSDYEHLRQLIEDALSELGIPDAQWSCVKAKSVSDVRISSLPPSDVVAIWRPDQDTIELYDEEERLLKKLSLKQDSTEQIMVA